MSLTPTIEEYLAREDFDALEEEWLGRVGEAPEDLDFFLATARALDDRSAGERARVLLELLDEELRGAGLWRARLDLLRRGGRLLLEPERLHPEIVATLRELVGSSPSFEGLADWVGLHRAPDDLRKTWKKVDRLFELLRLDVGTVVWMEGKGGGRVVEANVELERFKVDFESRQGVAVGFSAAPRLLEPLHEGHFRRRKLEEPERLRQLATEDPGALLAAVFADADEPLAAADLRDALSGIVPGKEWPSWWAEARKHPQLSAVGTGRQTYRWADSAADARETLWEEFDAATPRDRLRLLRRHAARDRELGRRMARRLGEAVTELSTREPALAFETLLALERLHPEVAGELGGASADLLAGAASVDSLLDGIEDRQARGTAYEAIRRQRDDWPELFAERVQAEPDPVLVDTLAAALAEGAPELRERLVEQVLAQPRKAPAAFVWLARRATEDRELLERNPLRLLQHLLDAWSAAEMRPYRRELSPMLEPGGTATRLVGALRANQVEPARDLIRRAAGLSDPQRDLLVEALERHFPELREREAKVLYTTPESLAAKQAELRRLLEEEIPANRRAIEEARALGDLRENFEYKSARQRHEYLSSRAAALEEQLRRARPIDLARVDTAKVRVGCRVELEGPDGARRELTVLGPWESDPESDVISYQSELGERLLGLAPGDTIELDGAPWTVRTIRRYA